MLTEADLPGFKMRMELNTNWKATQAPKPSALTKALENESDHDEKAGHLFLP